MCCYATLLVFFHLSCAVAFFSRAQAMQAWESTVFNLGHCHRKLGRLEQAAACYLRARELAPGHHSPHSALALTYHLQVDKYRSCFVLGEGREADLSGVVS